MKILLDHNVDRRFRRYLPAHDVKTTRDMRWEELANGVLLASAAVEQFEAVIAIDKKLEYEQNLKTLPLPVIVLDARTNSIRSLAPFAPFVTGLLARPLVNCLYFVQEAGNILMVTSPRPK